MMEIEQKALLCSFCSKEFCKKSNLNRHLAICKKKENKEVCSNTCSFCTKEFTKKSNLVRHITTCKKKKISIEEELRVKNEKIKELEKLKKTQDIKIKELQEKVRERSPHKISNKTINKQHIDTQNITNNNITIYQVMTPEHVLEVFQKHYKLDTLLGGQKALARFVNEEFLKEQATPIYMCGDRARQKFYMMKDGKKEEDPDCENIIGLSTPGFPRVREVYEDALFTTHKDITEEQIQDNYRSITNIDKDRAPFKTELSKIASNSETKTPWQNALAQLQTMRDNLLPYEDA
jgi:hypothetical protein